MKKWIGVSCILMFVLVLSACGASKSGADDHQSKEASLLEEGHSEKAGSNQAVHVELKNSEGEKVGIATLKQEAAGVNIAIEASNLPKGSHGFHIHEKGVCEAPSFESAGGHFNPTDAKHGFDNPDGPHAGDLPNLEVGEDGKVQESFLAEMVTLKKGEKNFLLREGGTALVIHADADDNVSQPAGNAGARIACGVIAE